MKNPIVITTEPRILPLNEVDTLEKWRYARQYATNFFDIERLDTIAKNLISQDPRAAIIFIRSRWFTSPLVFLVFRILASVSFSAAAILADEFRLMKIKAKA